MLDVSCYNNANSCSDYSNSDWTYAKKSPIDRSLTLSENDWKEKKNDIFTVSNKLKDEYIKSKRRIIELCQNQDDLNEPNESVQQTALAALRLLLNYEIMPSLINSTGDESLLFEFFVKGDFYLIEFYNSGELIYLRRVAAEGKHVTEINFEQLREAIAEIARAYK